MLSVCPRTAQPSVHKHEKMWEEILNGRWGETLKEQYIQKFKFVVVIFSADRLWKVGRSFVVHETFLELHAENSSAAFSLNSWLRWGLVFRRQKNNWMDACQIHSRTRFNSGRRFFAACHIPLSLQYFLSVYCLIKVSILEKILKKKKRKERKEKQLGGEKNAKWLQTTV